MQKKSKLIDRISLIHYGQTHFWFPICVSLFIMMMFSAIIFQSYVEGVYLSYLTRRTMETDAAVLATEQVSVNYMLEQFVKIGSEFAIDDNLYNCVQDGIDHPCGTSTLQMRLVCTALARSSDLVSVIAIQTGDGLLYQYDRNHGDTGTSAFWTGQDAQLEQMYDTVMEAAQSRSTVRYAVSSIPNQYSERVSTPLVHIAFPLLGTGCGLDNARTVVVISYQMEFLDEFLELSQIDHNGSTVGYITDKTEKIIYSGAHNYIGKSSTSYLTENQLTCLQCSVGQFDWNLHIAVDNASMRTQVQKMFRKAVLLYGILLVAVVAIEIFFLIYRLRPMRELTSAMEDVEYGHLERKIEIKGSHEIWRLAQKYNEMTESLKRQKQQTEQENREKMLSIRRANEAEREALESQINAHFLCNTLSAINYSAMEVGDNEVSLMLKKLSNILRYTFSATYEDVSMVQELAWVEQYLHLQRFRQMGAFDYQVDCPAEYEAWPCCKLFLQPFVENSITHGFEGLEAGGVLRIFARPAGDRLEVVVEDNGCGIEPERAALLQTILDHDGKIELHGIGIGIRNVVTRLRMYYGKNLSITLKTELGKGTTFRFLLPIPERLLDEEEKE